jgi:hypothetical protein
VRRWPRISDSSRTPPTEILSNLRPIAVAIDLPSDVLPTPGGPTNRTIPERASGFSLRTARNSMIRSLMRSMS